MKEAPKHLITEPKYGFTMLVIMLCGGIVIPAYIPQDTIRYIVTDLLLSFTLISSLYLVVYQLKELYIGIGLMLPCLITIWWNPPLPAPWHETAGLFLFILFTLYIFLHICRYLIETDQISVDMILASVCAYFLLGLLWSFIYKMIETSNPGSFYFLLEDKRSIDQLSYFSYVTLSTLGYGDITPVSPKAQSWALLESIAGQLYLTIIIARLIGLGISQKQKH